MKVIGAISRERLEIALLAFAQVVSWGGTYYSFSLFVVPMEADLGWSRTSLNAALSLGLLVSGLLALPVGSLIDRFGGRQLMTGGSILMTVLLVAWSRVESLWTFFAIWAGFGLAMAATYYEPLFAVITRDYRESYRSKITGVTLIGGFASTVFIPLTQWLIAGYGWRNALLALAAINLLTAFPIHLACLKERGEATDRPPLNSQRAGKLSRLALRRALGHPSFWALGLCFTAYYAGFSALTFHLVPLLSERGLAMTAVVAALAVIGPAQVAGRFLLVVFSRRASAKLAGQVVLLIFPLSLTLLIPAEGGTAALYAFAILYGGANGILTIVRGTITPELLGPAGYGAINGALTLPATFAKALAPLAAALIWTLAGYQTVLWITLACGLTSAAAFRFAIVAADRRLRPVPSVAASR